MTLEQLRAKLEALKTQMQALIDEGFTDENGNESKFDDLEKEAQSTRTKIDKLQRFEQSCAGDDTEGAGRRTQAQAAPRVEVTDNRTLDPTQGFKGIGEFARAVHSACDPHNPTVDDRLKVVGAPVNPHRQTGSSDGYQVPPEYKDSLYDVMMEMDEDEPNLLALADGEPTSRNSVQVDKDESTPWGATGVKAYWGAEASQFQRSRLDTKQSQIVLHKMHVMVEASDELIEDVPRLNDRLTNKSGVAMRWKGNEAIHFGTGSGQMLGFAKASSKIAVAKETGQAAATINADNVTKMYSRQVRPGRAIWIVNQDILPQLMTMTVGNHPIWTPPATGFANAPGGFLFGRPIMFSEQCQTLGTEGDINFVDPKGYYLLTKRQGIKFSASMHLLFDYDVECYKWTFRLGGQPWLSSAIAKKNGSNTKSHYVRLATRA